jgi:L-alanine-DL-glutamate epimerase-like enolase superfamily enzyme
LVPAITGARVEDTGNSWEKMVARVRNAGRPGVASTAISAVDIALWDLKAKAAGLPLFRLLGVYREAVPAVEGYLHPDPERPGLGLELKQKDAEKWRV